MIVKITPALAYAQSLATTNFNISLFENVNICWESAR
jgi:hypothetical protein